MELTLTQHSQDLFELENLATVYPEGTCRAAFLEPLN